MGQAVCPVCRVACLPEANAGFLLLPSPPTEPAKEPPAEPPTFFQGVAQLAACRRGSDVAGLAALLDGADAATEAGACLTILALIQETPAWGPALCGTAAPERLARLATAQGSGAGAALCALAALLTGRHSSAAALAGLDVPKLLALLTSGEAAPPAPQAAALLQILNLCLESGVHSDRILADTAAPAAMPCILALLAADASAAAPAAAVGAAAAAAAKLLLSQASRRADARPAEPPASGGWGDEQTMAAVVAAMARADLHAGAVRPLLVSPLCWVLNAPLTPAP